MRIAFLGKLLTAKYFLPACTIFLELYFKVFLIYPYFFFSFVLLKTLLKTVFFHSPGTVNLALWLPVTLLHTESVISSMLFLYPGIAASCFDERVYVFVQLCTACTIFSPSFSFFPASYSTFSYSRFQRNFCLLILLYLTFLHHQVFPLASSPLSLIYYSYLLNSYKNYSIEHKSGKKESIHQ